jgi:hypothetical protein
VIERKDRGDYVRIGETGKEGRKGGADVRIGKKGGKET